MPVEARQLEDGNRLVLSKSVNQVATDLNRLAEVQVQLEHLARQRLPLLEPGIISEQGRRESVVLRHGEEVEAVRQLKSWLELRDALLVELFA